MKDCGSMHKLTNKISYVSDIRSCNCKINELTNKMLIVIDRSKTFTSCFKLQLTIQWSRGKFDIHYLSTSKQVKNILALVKE